MSKITDKISQAMTRKAFLTWREGAGVVLGTEKFKPSDLGKITRAFDEALAGSSALLVDAGGRYSYRAPVAQHAGWLKAHGYTGVPEVKEKVSKSAVTLFSEPVVQVPSASQEIEAMKQQIEALTKLLTGKKKVKKTA